MILQKCRKLTYTGRNSLLVPFPSEMKLRTIVLSISLSICICSSAQETLIRPYLGITGGHTIMAGSFNGQDFFRTDEDIMLVPRIRPAFGVGGVAGLAYEKFSIDLAYHFARSEYTTSEEEYAGSCTNHMVRFLGVKKYFGAHSLGRLIPFVDVDLSMVINQLELIAYPMGNMNSPVSGRYGGISFGAGAGIRIILSDMLVADIRVLPEYYLGTDIRVKGRDWYQISKFGNLLLHNTIGINYQFGGF